MPLQMVFSLLALSALVPAALLPMRAGAGARRDGLYWVLLLIALAGPAAWTLAQTVGGWRAGFSAALWITVAASLAIFVLVAAVTREAWRLTPLLLPYLLILGLIATVWQHSTADAGDAAALGTWVVMHILLSVATYALLTIAAIAGLGVVLQERALKAKRPTALTRMLPSVADGEGLQLRLLKSSAILLGLGLITGMASAWISAGVLLQLDHKTLLTLLAFAVICLSLWAHHRRGVGGRRAARYVLLAYLLLTLGYPGVKFVTDVIVG
ncbi:MAG: cytochrome c biogenesis protein CcsA [Alphaproteobacteria bacterium]|nr:cytochrome c biogenesis protein CcsA [Alphaproteobacteria bacterium]